MDVAETHDPSAIAALCEEWTDLVERSENATIYQTWEWNEAWWRVYGQGKRLRLITVRRAGALIGIAPLYVSHHLGTPFRRLAFVGTGAADYLDVIAPSDEASAVCEAVLVHIGDVRYFDMADLQQLRPSAALLAAARARIAAGREHRRTMVAPQEPCPYVRLPDTWEAYGAAVGKKMRQNIGYYDRLLTRTFEDAEIRLIAGDQLDEAMDSLFDLHQQRWKARLLPGVLGGARIREFHRLVARAFHARGWLRLHITRAGGRPVAALYCFIFRRKTYYYLGGFDPALAKLSLGTVLTARAIRCAIEEGCEEFDFLRGHEPYKYRWTSDERVNSRVLVRRAGSLRSHALLRLNRVEQALEERVKALAENRGRSKR